jgi:hypothetical protein
LQLLKSICQKVNDEEEHSRLEVLRNTYQRARKDQTVASRKTLESIIVAPELEQLEQLLRTRQIPLSMREIDAIRQWKTEGDDPHLRPAWERNRRIGEKIYSDLKDKGHFLQTEGKDCYFFSSVHKEALQLESVEMQTILAKDYGINSEEPLYKFVRAALWAETVAGGEKVEVLLHSCYKPEEQLLYVYAGKGLVYRLDGTRIKQIENGTEGVFFKKQPGFEPWKGDFEQPVSVEDNLIKDLSFDFGESVSLTPKQQQIVYWVWVRSLFFAEILPSKPLFSLIGDINSGKTTSLRRFLKLFQGSKGEIAGLEDKDAYAPAVTSNHLLVLDNLNKPVKWLGNRLDRLATGGMILIRKLWVTNQEFPVWPRCFVAMTSIQAPFRELTTANRMIILKMKPRPQEIAQRTLEAAVLRDRGGLWADLLMRLNEDVELLKRKNIQSIQFRLQDFAELLQRLLLEKPKGSTLAKEILTRLMSEQDWQVLQFSPVPDLLALWSFEPGKWYSTGDLFREWVKLIEEEKLGITFFKSVQGFSRHLLDIAKPLQVCYGVAKTLELSKHRKTLWRFAETQAILDQLKEKEKETMEPNDKSLFQAS